MLKIILGVFFALSIRYTAIYLEFPIVDTINWIKNDTLFILASTITSTGRVIIQLIIDSLDLSTKPFKLLNKVANHLPDDSSLSDKSNISFMKKSGESSTASTGSNALGPYRGGSSNIASGSSNIGTGISNSVVSSREQNINNPTLNRSLIRSPSQNTGFLFPASRNSSLNLQIESLKPTDKSISDKMSLQVEVKDAPYCVIIDTIMDPNNLKGNFLVKRVGMRDIFIKLEPIKAVPITREVILDFGAKGADILYLYNITLQSQERGFDFLVRLNDYLLSLLINIPDNFLIEDLGFHHQRKLNELLPLNSEYNKGNFDISWFKTVGNLRSFINEYRDIANFQYTHYSKIHIENEIELEKFFGSHKTNYDKIASNKLRDNNLSGDIISLSSLRNPDLKY